MMDDLDEQREISGARGVCTSAAGRPRTASWAASQLGGGLRGRGLGAGLTLCIGEAPQRVLEGVHLSAVATWLGAAGVLVQREAE